VPHPLCPSSVPVLLFPGSADVPALAPAVNLHQTNNLYFILDNQYQCVIQFPFLGAQRPTVLPQVMRLRRAVLKTPAKSPVPNRLPFHKTRHLLTRSESILPQLLIPLHFNSRRCNAYKKAGEGVPPSYPKVCQLVTTRLPLLRTRRISRNPNPSYALLHNFWIPRGVGSYLSSQIQLLRFVRLSLRVCPSASFSYNARPFTREVNR
jgi:hypothetical protein